MTDGFDDADLLEIERALREDHDVLCRTARVPDASLVWWRATIRARADAARIAEHPIAVAHSIAGACVVALACALGGLAWRTMPEVILQYAVPLVAALALCLLVAPLAVVLALARD
jgi:hypothetical protein